MGDRRERTGSWHYRLGVFPGRLNAQHGSLRYTVVTHGSFRNYKKLGHFIRESREPAGPLSQRKRVKINPVEI